MSEMIDRVAKALFAQSFPGHPEAREVIEANWHQMAPELLEKWRGAARSAVEEMRVPTTQMMDAVQFDWYIGSACATVYQTMIDEALK